MTKLLTPTEANLLRLSNGKDNAIAERNDGLSSLKPCYGPKPRQIRTKNSSTRKKQDKPLTKAVIESEGTRDALKHVLWLCLEDTDCLYSDVMVLEGKNYLLCNDNLDMIEIPPIIYDDFIPF